MRTKQPTDLLITPAVRFIRSLARLKNRGVVITTGNLYYRMQPMDSGILRVFTRKISMLRTRILFCCAVAIFCVDKGNFANAARQEAQPTSPVPEQATVSQVRQATYVKDTPAVAEAPKEASEKRTEVAEQIRVAEIKVKEEEQKQEQKIERQQAQLKLDTEFEDPITPLVDTATRPHAATQASGTAQAPLTPHTNSTPDAANQPVAEVASLPKPVNTTEQLRLRLLKQIDVILAQQEQQKLGSEDIVKDLKLKLAELETVKDGNIDHPQPWSFLLLDQLQEELATVKSSIKNTKTNQAINSDDIVRAKKLVETREAAKRLAGDANVSAAVQEQAPESIESLEIRLARETLNYRKTRQEILAQRVTLLDVQKSIVEIELSTVREESVFDEADLASKSDDLKKRETQLRNDIKRVEGNLENADAEWLTDRQNQLSGTSLTNKERAEAEMRRHQRQRLEQELTSLNFRLELLSETRNAWEQRYCLSNNLLDREAVILASQEAQLVIDQRSNDLDNALLRIGELRKIVGTLETRADTLADDDAGRTMASIIRRQRYAVQANMRVLDEDIASIQQCSRIHEKLLDDVSGDLNRFSFSELAATSWFHIKNVWNTELTQVDERPITIGKVLTALAIFIGGFWLARFFSRRMRIFTGRRLKFDESASAAFESLSFYALLIAAMLSALNFVSIPLTVFTFLGGALAIGVGFGSQNVLGNFISGLIMLAERPVKVGDLIQLDEFFGNIEHIGARSTLVRTGTNLQLIVPNSKFLENNVINLTHGRTEELRTSVTVGVQYGSKLREVTKLLKQAATEHGLISKKPEPFVIFTEFGDSSLQFELHFWLKVAKPMDRMRVQSDVRYRIDSLFQESGIVISFPQRDIHLDSSGPLDIRLIRAKADDNSIRAA